MILIIGSAASGKKEYVKSLGYTDADISCDFHDDRPVLYGLETIVFADTTLCDELATVLLSKEVVICCEVGSGIIPAEKGNREAREATGRLCALLAKKADKVVRLVCGIPIVIKE
ncbi:MAG: bifunctional adenosylcobinamide kinase/adenosylcobinamide-phosphate guanylyltransferase [Clostridia bacterium]|nr:bifunctional adenosylcobinamide kinase/adenosylcobinamide-phosphate guanylyltransferase [Clostridia bacterium]